MVHFRANSINNVLRVICDYSMTYRQEKIVAENGVPTPYNIFCKFLYETSLSKMKG